MVQRGDYTETDTKRDWARSLAGKFCLGCFHFVRTFPSKPKFTYCFIHSKNFSLEKQMLFSLFCFFCIFAQGFSLKMQLFDQKTAKMRNLKLRASTRSCLTNPPLACLTFYLLYFFTYFQKICFLIKLYFFRLNTKRSRSERSRIWFQQGTEGSHQWS